MIEAIAELVRYDVEIEIGLEPKPELRGRVEVSTQTESGISAHTALAKHDLVDPTRWNPDAQREAVLAEAERLQELLLEHFTRVDGGELASAHRAPPISGNPRSRHRRHPRSATRSTDAKWQSPRVAAPGH